MEQSRWNEPRWKVQFLADWTFFLIPVFVFIRSCYWTWSTFIIKQKMSKINWLQPLKCKVLFEKYRPSGFGPLKRRKNINVLTFNQPKYSVSNWRIGNIYSMTPQYRFWTDIFTNDLEHCMKIVSHKHKYCSQSVHLIQSCGDLTLWDMNLAVSAPDGSFPIAVIVWCCSPSDVASSFTQCHVGLGSAVVLF